MKYLKIIFLLLPFGFSEDRRSFSFEVNLEPDKQYQSIVVNFRNENDFPVKPFVIDFKTTR